MSSFRITYYRTLHFSDQKGDQTGKNTNTSTMEILNFIIIIIVFVMYAWRIKKYCHMLFYKTNAHTYP